MTNLRTGYANPNEAFFQIRLRQNSGYAALVDDQDLPELSKSRWAYKEGYAVRTVKVGPGKYKKQYLHHAIVQVPPEHQVLFRNRNGLDCRRENLQILTIFEAKRAARPRKNASSPFKGVSLLKDSGSFKAEIVVDGRVLFLGTFHDEKAAARAYDAAARTHFGPVAYLNFPEEVPLTGDRTARCESPEGELSTF